jgi:hypothetical protein
MKNVTFVLMFLFILSGCSSLPEKGIYFSSTPEAATLVCGNKEFGRTPKVFWFSDEQKYKEKLSIIDECYAIWISGERENYSLKEVNGNTSWEDKASIGVTVIRKRNSGYAQDAEFGLKVETLRSQELEAMDNRHQLKKSLRRLQPCGGLC